MRWRAVRSDTETTASAIRLDVPALQPSLRADAINVHVLLTTGNYVERGNRMTRDLLCAYCGSKHARDAESCPACHVITTFGVSEEIRRDLKDGWVTRAQYEYQALRDAYARPSNNRRDMLCAARDVLIFVAFVGLLVTAPAWGEWLDDDYPWAVSAAEHHAKMYERLNERSTTCDR